MPPSFSLDNKLCVHLCMRIYFRLRADLKRRDAQMAKDYYKMVNWMRKERIGAFKKNPKHWSPVIPCNHTLKKGTCCVSISERERARNMRRFACTFVCCLPLSVTSTEFKSYLLQIIMYHTEALICHPSHMEWVASDWGQRSASTTKWKSGCVNLKMNWNSSKVRPTSAPCT